MKAETKAQSLMLAVLLVTGCQQQPQKPPPVGGLGPIQVFVSSDLRGEVEPCGCNLEPLGGLARLGQALGQAPVVTRRHLLLHGDLLAEAHGPKEEAYAQFQLKAQFLSQQLQGLGLSLAVSGPADRKLPAKLWPKNFGGSPSIKPGGIQVLSDGLLVIREPLPTTVPEADVTVLVSERPLEDLRQARSTLLKAGVDLVLLGGQKGEQPIWTALAPGLFVLRSGERGQRLARLDLHIRGPGILNELPGAASRKRELEMIDKRITSTQELRDRLRVKQASSAAIEARSRQLQKLRKQRNEQAKSALPSLPDTGNYVTLTTQILDSQIGDEPNLAKAVADHHRKVGSMNRQAEASRQCPEPDPKQAQYIGSKACASCHPAAYQLWKSTTHSQAWDTLVQAGRDYDYACVSCHSAGFGEDQGFCKVTEAADRVNVGCEACHGPGSKHADRSEPQQIERDRGVDACKSCHHPPHTKAFHGQERLARILGPGHGLQADGTK